MEMKQIILVGSFGASNIGDEAILESTLQMLRRESKELKIHVLSATPVDTQEFYEKYTITSSLPIPFGIKSILKNSGKFFKSLKKLRSTDAVFFPGGGLFTDNETLYAILLWGVHFFFFKTILKKRVVFGGQSVGPITTVLGKIITRYVLHHSDGFYVRDQESLEYIQKHFQKYSAKVSLLFDPVCFIDKTPPKTTPEEPFHIALSLRPWHGTEHHLIHMLGKVFKHLSEEKKIHIHLIPMQYKGSEDVSPLQHMSYILHQMDISSTIHAPRSYTDVLKIFEKCQIAIGMRLHFLILSALSHTPLLALSYSTKVEGFLKRINLHSSVNIASLHQDDLEKSIFNLTKTYSEQFTYLDIFASLCKSRQELEANILLSSLGIKTHA